MNLRFNVIRSEVAGREAIFSELRNFAALFYDGFSLSLVFLHLISLTKNCRRMLIPIVGKRLLRPGKNRLEGVPKSDTKGAPNIDSS